MYSFDFEGIGTLLIIGLAVLVIVSVIGPWLILSGIAWFVPVFWLTAHIVGAVWAVVALIFWLLVFFGG